MKEAAVMRTADLDYHLPPEWIATHPVEPRDAARLMVVHRALGIPARHLRVRDLPSLVRSGDLLVLNTTKVLPARLLGVREDTGARVQGLYVAPASTPDGAGMGERRWNVLLKMRRFQEGARV